MQPRFYIHPSDSPYETLAAEEAILESVHGIVLLLYRHRPSVIVGRTQNAWAECRTDRMEKDGVLLARRISGGGAVYHDPENLNFSFIAAPDIYDLDRQLRVILEAVRSFGISASFSGRNDILADGRKFSGNAFCVRRQGSFHHGTLLIGTDGEKMARYLSVPPDKIASKGIRSVRSRVVNLRELAPQITSQAMADALRSAFEAEYGTAPDWAPDPALAARARQLAERNRSWEWRLGKTPPFDIEAATRFPWGGFQIRFQLIHGRVAAAQVYSDAMEPELILSLPEILQGHPFSSSILSAALNPLATDPRVRDIQQFLLTKGY